MNSTKRASVRTRRAVPFALAAAAVVGLATPAQAGESYRYWSFWEAKNSTGSSESWGYAAQGPATAKPEDGDVLGFRFAVSEDSGDAAKPRPRATFAKVCADEDPEGEGKRIALSLDFGTAKDAPDGAQPPKPRTECATVPEDATAAEVLAEVAKPLRYDSDGMLCGVEGYPKRGCGEAVSDGAASGSDESKDGKGSADSTAGSDEGDGGLSTGAGIGTGVAAVVILGGAAYWQARRRRS